MSRIQSQPNPNTAESPQPDDSSVLAISVIVPIRNEQGFIGRTLEGLLSQDYPSEAFEIIVVDGDSTDASPQIVDEFAAKHSNVILLHNPKRWSSAARNVGVDASTGEVVIIVDGHCQFFDNQYLRNVDQAFRNSNADCLGRPQPLDVEGGSVVQQAISLARSSRLGHHPDSFIYSESEQTVPAHSVGVAYKKSVFERIGKFDENFDACEDVEFNQRVDDAGLHCVLAPSIRLRYYPRSSIQGLFRQMARYGRGRVRLFRKHAHTFSWKSLAPAVFLACIIAGLLPAIFVPALRLPYFGAIGLYMFIVCCFSASIAKGFRTLYYLPLVFMAIHFGAGYGALKELVFGSKHSDPLDR